MEVDNLDVAHSMDPSLFPSSLCSSKLLGVSTSFSFTDPEEWTSEWAVRLLVVSIADDIINP